MRYRPDTTCPTRVGAGVGVEVTWVEGTRARRERQHTPGQRQRRATWLHFGASTTMVTPWLLGT